MFRKKYTRVIVPTILIATVVVFSLWQLLVYFSIYNHKFSESLKEAKPKLEELNASTIAELHPPEGVRLIQQSNLDLHIPAYDSYLYSEYKVVSGDMNDILNIYKQILESLGWKLSSSEESSSSKTYFYFRDSACVEIEIFPENRVYRVLIKHDFRQQSFGVKPNNLIENFYTLLLFYNPCPP